MTKIVFPQVQDKKLLLKKLKKLHRFENNLKEIKNPTYRISLRKLRLGAHILRIQTGKSKTAAQQYLEHTERAWFANKTRSKMNNTSWCFAMGTMHYTRSCLIVFHVRLLFLWTLRLTAHDRIKYLLTADNNNRTIYTRKDKTCPK